MAGPAGQDRGREAVPGPRRGRGGVLGRRRRGRGIRLPREIAQILTLQAAHGDAALVAALERAVEFRRWRADDVRSILAAGGAAPTPRPAGQALVLTLPAVPVRPLTEYAFGGEEQ